MRVGNLPPTPPRPFAPALMALFPSLLVCCFFSSLSLNLYSSSHDQQKLQQLLGLTARMSCLHLATCLWLVWAAPPSPPSTVGAIAQSPKCDQCPAHPGSRPATHAPAPKATELHQSCSQYKPFPPPFQWQLTTVCISSPAEGKAFNLLNGLV